MSRMPQEFQQPRIDFIDRRYVTRERLSDEQIQPFYSEAVDLAQKMCTLGFYKCRKPYSPRGMSGLHYTETHALSPRVPYQTPAGKQIELGVRYSTHCSGDDPVKLADPSEKVVELGIFFDHKGKDKESEVGQERHFRLHIVAALHSSIIRTQGRNGALYQYPDNNGHSEGYHQNRPKDLDAFMKGIRYAAQWLEAPRH